MNQSFTIIIPARLHSTRLPQKMLQPIEGKPLIEWTWRQALKANAKRTIIATDTQALFDHMHNLGATVVITSEYHASGTDRLSEVATQLNLDDAEIVVNWQGDEPFLPYVFIDKVVQRLRANPTSAMSTLGTPITNWADFCDPNIVKLVMNQENEALYFSRAPIPYPRDFPKDQGPLPQEMTAIRHLGLYAYRGYFLKGYSTLTPSPLETLERLEQLRALANGHKISVECLNESPPLGIDTQEDLEKARLWAKTLAY